ASGRPTPPGATQGAGAQARSMTPQTPSAGGDQPRVRSPSAPRTFLIHRAPFTAPLTHAMRRRQRTAVGTDLEQRGWARATALRPHSNALRLHSVGVSGCKWATQTCCLRFAGPRKVAHTVACSTPLPG